MLQEIQNGFRTTLKRLCSNSALALLGVGVLVGGPATPQPRPPSAAKIYPKAILSVGLPVGRIPVLEHSSIKLPFFLSVEPGVGGARPTYDLVVCLDGDLQCTLFPQVTPPWTSPNSSSLTLKAPAAGQSMPIKLVACIALRNAENVMSCGHQLSDDTVRVDVSLRFSVSVDSFNILHTRAQSKDTTFVSLAGIANGQTVPTITQCGAQTAAFQLPTFCIGPTGAGDLSAGNYPVKQMRIGEFEWVPGQEKNVTFAFAVVNYGAPVLSLTGPTLDMRRITMQHQLQKLTAANSGVLEDFTDEVNNLNGWRGCDGPTAAGAKRIFNFKEISQQESTVDELTKATGQYSMLSKTYKVPSQTGCGASSQYQVRWTLVRTSWASQ